MYKGHLWITEESVWKKKTFYLWFTKQFEFKGRCALTQTLIVQFSFSIWQSWALSAGFREITVTFSCVYSMKNKNAHSSLTPRLLVWDLNCFVASKFYWSLTGSKTVIYLLQIFNDKNLWMNLLSKRSTSTKKWEVNMKCF